MSTIQDIERRLRTAENEIAEFQKRNKGAPVPPDLRAECKQAGAAYRSWRKHPPLT